MTHRPPLYVRVSVSCVGVDAICQVMHAGPQHQALLPASETPKPWDIVAAATYANLKNVPVLYSRSIAGGRGRWVCPGQAVVVEAVEQKGGGEEEEERVDYAKRLTKVLLLSLFDLLWLYLRVVRDPVAVACRRRKILSQLYLRLGLSRTSGLRATCGSGQGAAQGNVRRVNLTHCAAEDCVGATSQL